MRAKVIESSILSSTEPTLWDQALDELERELTPSTHERNAVRRIDDTSTIDRLSLVDFVERTSNVILEPWQHHLCGILQSLTHTKGRRILIHKPPQHGGSIIVSQRLPAYIVGDSPNHRVKLACYNIEHATAFTAINKMIMQSPEYRNLFKDRGKDVEIVPFRAPDKAFFTRKRRDFRDGQPSIAALGLQTGFVGQGADTLIIDDPYASPQEAESETVCENVWNFWIKGASVRIDDDCNVIVMFHRYHEDDFVGQLIKEEGLLALGGKWELYSYRAQWDGDERLEVGGPDPMNRVIGEYLSPRKAKQKNYYNEQKRNSSVWNSQFQGKPSKEDGNMFKVYKIKIIPRLTVGLEKVALAWDLASTEDGGDWTVGVVMGLGYDEYVYVLDVVRFRKDTDERNKIIRRTANRWRAKYSELVVVIPQDPASAGKDTAKSLQKVLKGHTVEIVSASHRGSKVVKADPWSAYVNGGLSRIVFDGDINAKDDNGDYISWVYEWLDEHKKFPAQKQDDQIDASSDAFNQIALDLDMPPGEDFDIYGINSKDDEILINLNAFIVSQEELNDRLIREFMQHEGDVEAVDSDYFGGYGHVLDVYMDDGEGNIDYGNSKKFGYSSSRNLQTKQSKGRSTKQQRENAKKAKLRRPVPYKSN